MKKINPFFALIILVGFSGWFSFCKNTGKPVVPPVVVVDSTAIALADSISRNWWCASIRATQAPSQAVAVNGKFWPVGSVITYKYAGGTAAQRAWTEKAFAEIAKSANLKFQQVATGTAILRIGFDPNQGAWSYIGTDCKNIPQSTITCNVGWQGLDVAIHELMHAMGFGHEQSSPMGGICWDKPIVYADLAKPPNSWSKTMVDNNVFFVYSLSQVTATAFDPISIMEYQIPASWTCNKQGIPGGKVLSELDKFMLGKIYPGATIVPDPPNPANITITIADRDRILNAVRAATVADSIALSLAKSLLK